MILHDPAVIRDYAEKGYWGTETLDDLFQKNAARTPEALALADPPNRAELAGGEPQRLTYAQLRDQVDRLATSLLRLGVGRDDIIMTQLPNTVEIVLVYLAAARIGAVVSPLPVQYRTHELRQTLALTEPKVFVTASSFAGFNNVEMVQGLSLEFPSLKTIVAVGPEAPDVTAWADLLAGPADPAALVEHRRAQPWTADDIFTICWTSGTEAEPKGVPRSHNLWIAIAWVSVDGAELQEGAALLSPFPMVNMSALGGMLVPWLLTGGKMVLHHPLNLPVFLGQIQAEKINYTVAPPVLMNLLLANEGLLAHVDISTLKKIGSGSAPLSPWMTAEWKKRHDVDVINLFGSNEGVGFVSAPREIPSPEDRARFFPRYGTPGFTWQNRGVRGMEAILVDPLTGREVTEPGTPGELRLKGPTVFAGYFKRPEVTARSFDEAGFFRTGDLFEIDGTGGDRYRFVGRLKDLIIRGGMKIAPEEIEGLILEHPKVAEVAVFGVPDRLEEEKICAVVVPKKDQTVELREIHEFLRAKDIALYKMPKKLVTVTALPRNPVGKVLKRNLRSQYQES